MAAMSLGELNFGDQFKSLDALDVLDFSLYGASPVECIAALREPQHVKDVRKRLRQPDVDEQWMTAFVEEGGLSAIWKVFEACVKYRPPRISTLFKCIQCIQAIVAMPGSADLLVRSSEELVGKLVLGAFLWSACVFTTTCTTPG